MWTMAKIADRDGVSRQAVQKAIRKFATDGVITGIERDQKGHITAVNVVEYDRARGTATDPAKLRGGATKKSIDEDTSPQATKLPSDYTRAITEKALYETELKKLELSERQGQLVPLEELDRQFRNARTKLSPRSKESSSTTKNSPPR
jgi:GTP-sensing pleiotropic transcriptional regulator CodY